MWCIIDQNAKMRPMTVLSFPFGHEVPFPSERHGWPDSLAQGILPQVPSPGSVLCPYGLESPFSHLEVLSSQM